MLSKIEGILKFKTGKTTNENDSNDEQEDNEETKTQEDIQITQTKKEDEEPADSGKIDLNRMESLLNGFGSK
jgi:hypothetical protein